MALLCADCNALRVPFRPQLFQKCWRQRTAEVSARHTGWLWSHTAFRRQVKPMGSKRIKQASDLNWQAQVARIPFCQKPLQGKGVARLQPQLGLSSQQVFDRMCRSQFSQNSMSWSGRRCGQSLSSQAAFRVLRTSSGAAIEVARLVILQWAILSLLLVTKHVAITPLSDPQRVCIDQHAARRVSEPFPAVR